MNLVASVSELWIGIFISVPFFLLVGWIVHKSSHRGHKPFIPIEPSNSERREEANRQMIQIEKIMTREMVENNKSYSDAKNSLSYTQKKWLSYADAQRMGMLDRIYKSIEEKGE